MKDSIIRDRLVFGAYDKKVRERLLEEGEPMARSSLRMEQTGDRVSAIERPSVHNRRDDYSSRTWDHRNGRREVYPHRSRRDQDRYSYPSRSRSRSGQRWRSSNAKSVLCSYCKIRGHVRKNCFKLQRSRQSIRFVGDDVSTKESGFDFKRLGQPNNISDSEEDLDCMSITVRAQVFIEIRKFQKHVRAHRNRDSERYKCSTCAKTFQTGTILKRHMRIHMPKALFTCDVCKRKFNTEEHFHKHKFRHLQQQYNQQNGYVCTVCDGHFTCKVDLRVHMQVHYPNNPNYSIHTDVLPDSLRDSSSYPRGCEEPNCKYIAPSYTLMWSHYRNHYKLYQCEECDRKFATATILKNHVEVIHRKLRKFHCDQCPKTFAYPHKLKEHQNVHRGIRNRKCRFCGKSFTHSSTLRVHEKVHQNIKPHKCDICHSSYVTTSALKKHRKTHRTNWDVPVESYEEIDVVEEKAAGDCGSEDTIVQQSKHEPKQEDLKVDGELIYFTEDANEQVLNHHQEEEEEDVEVGEEVVTVKELCEILEAD